jgi:hypothetical protein
MECSLCGRDVDPSDIKWRNPLRPVTLDANGVLGLAMVEYETDPGQQDPGAAPYCSKCRDDMDPTDSQN